MSSKKALKIKKDTIKKAVIITVIIIAVLFIGWQKFGPETDSIAATVNGNPIYKEDVLREYIKVPPEYRTLVTVDSILEGMIIEGLVLQEAGKRGLSTSDKEVEDYIVTLLGLYGMTEADLVQQLADSETTLDEFKVSLKKRITISKVLNETILADLEVTESEIEFFYEKNSEQFITPEQIMASHILLNTSKEATSVRNKALGGVKFDELAEKYSIGPSAPNGGDLGWFGKGQMVKEFEDAAFALKKVGDMSPVVETQFGFHVIKLTGKQPESVQSLEDVRDDLEATILSQKQNAAIEVYTAQLKSAADIDIFMKSMEEPEGIPIGELIRKSNNEEDTNEAAEESDLAEEEPVEEAPENEPAEETGEVSLAECMTSKGVKLFGSETSEISQEQKALFGDDFSIIEYVDCSAQKETCKESSVISYPTWIINGKKYTGKYSLERLAEISGCS